MAGNTILDQVNNRDSSQIDQVKFRRMDSICSSTLACHHHEVNKDTAWHTFQENP